MLGRSAVGRVGRVILGFAPGDFGRAAGVLDGDCDSRLAVVRRTDGGRARRLSGWFMQADASLCGCPGNRVVVERPTDTVCVCGLLWCRR